MADHPARHHCMRVPETDAKQFQRSECDEARTVNPSGPFSFGLGDFGLRSGEARVQQVNACVVLGSVLMAGAVAPQAMAQSATAVGKWDAVVVVSNGTIDIPFTFEIVQTAAGVRGQFINGDEKVVSQPGTIENGNVELRFDQYGAKVVTRRCRATSSKASMTAARAGRKIRSRRVVRRPPGRQPRRRRTSRVSGAFDESSKGESAWRFIVRQTGPAVTASILRIDGDTVHSLAASRTASS